MSKRPLLVKRIPLKQNPRVHAAAYEWLADMIRRDWLDQATFNEYDLCEALTVDGEVVCFIIFKDHYTLRGDLEVRIKGAWTHPAWRRKGLYKRLFERLCKKAGRANALYIRSGYHKNNLISAQMQASRGSKLMDDDPLDMFAETRHSLEAYRSTKTKKPKKRAEKAFQ